MSVLTEVFAVPSRVLGVYRYLLYTKGQGDSLETICKYLAPESLPRQTDGEEDDEKETGEKMVQRTVRECVIMRLLVDVDGFIRINPELPEYARTPRLAETRLPITIADLFFSKDCDANYDFGHALAWYLSQDAYDAPGTWPDVDRALRDQIGGDQFGMKNSNPYRMLEDWACYLGFAWTHSVGERAVPTLMPDPTEHMRRRIADILPGRLRTRHPFQEATARLALLSPVFEGGFLRTSVERIWGAREPNHLSNISSLAWLRLHDEGFIELLSESDAATVILPDGDITRAYSHVSLLRTA